MESKVMPPASTAGCKSTLSLNCRAALLGNTKSPEDEIKYADQDHDAQRVAKETIGVISGPQRDEPPLKARQETNEQIEEVDQGNNR